MMISTLGSDHIDVSKVHSNTGDALLGAGRYGEAVEAYGAALRIRTNRSGLEHCKSKRLLEKIRVAALAAAAKKEQKEGSLSSSSSVVESLPMMAFDDDGDLRDLCLLTDDWESDDEDGADGAPPWKKQLGDIKSELELDLDRISDIGRDLQLDIVREQTAISKEIKKYDNDAHDECVQVRGVVAEIRGSAEPETEPDAQTPHIRSAKDGEAAVVAVRERLARVRERRKVSEDDERLEALRRVPVTARNTVSSRYNASK